MTKSSPNSREMLRRHLDARLRQVERIQTPTGGWLRTLRRALGMTMEQLADRLQISQPSVADLEERESRGTISVSKLREAAAALECDLVVVLVPRTSLTEMVRNQAARKANEERSRLLHTMGLEAQNEGIDTSTDESRLIEEWIAKRSRRLWD